MENEQNQSQRNDRSSSRTSDPAVTHDSNRDTSQYDGQTRESSLPDWEGSIRQPDRVDADENERQHGSGHEMKRNDNLDDKQGSHTRDDFRRDVG